MNNFLQSRRKAPQRRSMDAHWGEAEPDREWVDLLRLATKTWKVETAALRVKQPSGAWALRREGLDAPSMEALASLEAQLPSASLLLHDLGEHEAWRDHDAMKGRFGFVAAVALPDGDGSLWLLGSAPRAVDPEAEEALALLGDQAAHLHRLKTELHGKSGEEVRYRTIMEALMEGVVFMDKEARILACNPSAERILGWSESQLAGRASVDEKLTAIHEDGSVYAVDAHPSIRTLRTGRPCVGVVQGLQNAAGHRTWISINAQPLQHPWEDKPHGVVVSFSDITHLKEIEERLMLEATHDVLTGMRNRRHFIERLGAALKVAKRHGDPLSICVCDLDRFKDVNDTYGHATGDLALQRMAKLLGEELRGDEDLPARFGGDEFVVLFPRSTAAEAAVSMERVRLRLHREPLHTEDGQQLTLSGSFGIAQLSDLTMSQEELFEDADQALYEAKRTGRNRVVVAAE